ncbi:hypothetical protein FRC17_007564, partial [Serendipita sp. 399]
HAQNETTMDIYDVKLPLELWEIIFKLVLHEIRHPYSYCTPETYPRYQLRFRYWIGSRWDSPLKDWKAIRLVCRTWRYLAGPQPHVNFSQVPPNFSLPDALKGVSSILLQLDTGTAEIILPALLQHPSISSNLTTIDLGSYAYWPNSPLLLDNPKAFPNVRCLSLPGLVNVRSFWRALQDGYPQLVSLTIRYNIMPAGAGDYVFPNLEILNLYSWGYQRLSCPSLKHFAIRMWSTSIAEFVTKHGHQLQSFVLDQRITSSLIWSMPGDLLRTTLPNLQMFGGEISSTLPSPPPGHPLRHLRLFAQACSLDIHGVLKRLEPFPEITHLHIQFSEFGSSTINDLREHCIKRKIKLVDVLNVKGAPSAT